MRLKLMLTLAAIKDFALLDSFFLLPKLFIFAINQINEPDLQHTIRLNEFGFVQQTICIIILITSYA